MIKPLYKLLEFMLSWVRTNGSLLCCSLVVTLCSAVGAYQHSRGTCCTPAMFSEEGNSSCETLLPIQQTASCHNQKITTHIPSFDLSNGSGKYRKSNQDINSQCTLMFSIYNLNKNIKHQTVTLSHQVSTQSLLQLSFLIPVDRSFSPVLYQPSSHNCFHFVIICISVASKTLL